MSMNSQVPKPLLEISLQNASALAKLREINLSDSVLTWLVKVIDEAAVGEVWLEEGQAFAMQGNYLVKKHQVYQALLSYLKSLELGNSTDEVYYNLGVIHSAFWQTNKSEQSREEAAVCLKHATDLNPKHAKAYFELGNIIACDHAEQAVACWMQAIRIAPDFRDALIKLSNDLVWRQDKIDDGLEIFEQAYRLDPDNLEIYNQTNFNWLYQRGKYTPKVIEHCRSRTSRAQERSQYHQLDQIGVKFLFSAVENLGHYNALDALAKLKILGWLPAEMRLLILTKDNNVANPALLNLLKPYFGIINDKWTYDQLKPLEKFLEFSYDDIPGYNQRFRGGPANLEIDVQVEWERQNRPPLLSLSESEIARGWDTLERMGVPRGAWFVGLHVRDDGFKGVQPDTDARNTKIENFVPAIEEIVKRGGWVIKMGDPKSRPLPYNHPQAIDYAHSPYKSDWMDVFLWAISRFFIGTNSGPVTIPVLFGVPRVYIDGMPLSRNVPWSGQDLMLPTLFWSDSEGRWLSFAEMLDPDGVIDWACSSEHFKSKGLKLKLSTPEEIHGVVVEMLDRLDGKLIYSEQDQALKSRLDALVRRVAADRPRPDHVIRIGRTFLNRFQGLI